MIPLLVFLGAGLGGVARYALGGLIQQATSSTFPWGTLVVNVSGSLLIGILYVLLTGFAASPQWRIFVGIGFCGGYTTFSTFSYETARLLQNAEWNRATLYTAGSALLCIAATIAGFRIADLILRKG